MCKSYKPTKNQFHTIFINKSLGENFVINNINESYDY
jgi:hypothetical protein